MKLQQSVDPVTYLFSSPATVRILRYMSVNDSSSSTVAELQDATALTKKQIRAELKNLSSAGLTIERKRKKGKGYQINKNSALLPHLRKLIRFDFESHQRDIAGAFRKVGKVKALILTGEITDNRRAEVDLVVVASDVDEKKLNKLLQGLGHKCGFELRYVLLTPEEFEYRVEMNDRLIRNIIDFEHSFIIGSLS